MMKSTFVSAMSLIVALLRAVSKGDFEQCQSLIQQGAYVDGRDAYGNSPPHAGSHQPQALQAHSHARKGRGSGQWYHRRVGRDGPVCCGQKRERELRLAPIETPG